MEKEYFSTGELAAILGFSRITVFKKIKSGEIEAQKIGRNYIIPKEELPKILGEVLSTKSKDEIEHIVRRLVKEYGETLRLLARE